MSFLNTLGSIAKIAAPIVGTIAGGPFGALIGAGISKAIGGIQQGSEAGQINNPRPVDAPENELLQNTAEADANARNGMDAQQYGNAQDNIQRNMNFGLRTAVNRGNPLAVLSGLTSAGNDATNSLNQQDELDRQRNQATAYQIRSALARRRQQAFDWNDKQKFLENASAIRALKASSNQNIFGGLNTLGTAMAYKNGTGTGSGGGFLSGLSGLFSGGSSAGAGSMGSVSLPI